jgi:uncharacterized coiled-coil protein SlyX
MTFHSNNRILEIMREAEAGRVMSPEQEAEIQALTVAQVQDAVQAIVFQEQRIKELDALLKEAKIVLAFKQDRVDALRPQVTKMLEKVTPTKKGVRKVEADDGLFTAYWQAARGGVELLVPVSDLPAQYTREVREINQDTDMIRMALEAGLEPKTEDGRPIARLKDEPFTKIMVNPDKLVEYQIKGLLA